MWTEGEDHQDPALVRLSGDEEEFEQFQSFRTHDLETLLLLSGREPTISTAYAVEWSGVVQWDPEVRYTRIGTTNRATAEFTIRCAERLLRVL